MSANNVPIPDSHNLGDRTFAAVVREAEAGAQITGSFSLTWRALLQRVQSFTTDS